MHTHHCKEAWNTNSRFSSITSLMQNVTIHHKFYNSGMSQQRRVAHTQFVTNNLFHLATSRQEIFLIFSLSADPLLSCGSSLFLSRSTWPSREVARFLFGPFEV